MSPAAIVEAARLIRDGAVVAIPTDTVYGLAASLFQEEAMARVHEVKRRPGDQPFPILLGTAADLTTVVSSVPRLAWRLIDRFWPGPMTLVLPARPTLSAYVRSRGGTVAVRVPGGRACLLLLETLGEPVIGTSANVHASAPAETARQVVDRIGHLVDAVLEDDPAVRGGQASTVVEVGDSVLVVRRRGAVPFDAVAGAAGPRVRVLNELVA